MLQKLKYEALNFDKYQQLRKKFLSCEFIPQEVTELDLSKCGSATLPPMICLKLMVSLEILNLSRNKIDAFNGNALAKVCPNLIALDLSDNEIKGLNDIIELGNLQNLQKIDFSRNPVCAAYNRIQIIQLLFYPDKYGKYDPVQVLTATYSHVPNYQYSKKEYEILKRNERILEKNTVELLRADFKEDSKINKYDHKNTLLKYSMIPCPMNRKCRFKNILFLNNKEINRLEILRASGADKVNQVLEHGEEYYFKTFTRSINEYIQQKREEKVVKRMPRENQQLQDKYVERYKKRIIRAASTDLAIQLNQQQQQKNDVSDHDSNGSDNGENLQYLAQIDTVNAVQRKNTKNARLQAIEQWEKPIDILYKDAEYNIPISEHKKMMQDYEEEKRKKKNAEKQFFEEERARIQKEKLENKKRKQMEARQKQQRFSLSPSKFSNKKQQIKANNFIDQSIDPDELSSDRETRMISKRRKSKPRFRMNLKREENYGTSESDLDEEELNQKHFQNHQVDDEISPTNNNKTQQKKQQQFTDPMTYFQIKKMKGHLSTDQLIQQSQQQQQQSQQQTQQQEKQKLIQLEKEDKQQKKIKEVKEQDKDDLSEYSAPIAKQLHKEKGLTFEQLVQQEENQDLTNLQVPEKVNLNVDEILPSKEQGLPSNRKFEILHTKSEQQQNIFETKKSLENALNVLEYSRYRDKLHGKKRDLFHTNKKLASYDEIFDILKKSFPDLRVDASFCHLIQDILYYVNDYDPSNEPKITERDTLRKLKQKNLTSEELDQCQRELEVLDAIKLRSQKLNKQGLKRIEKKEIHQAEENAVLAAHYFRLKKYYKNGEFDKYVKQLNLEVQNEVIDINIQGKQKVVPVAKKPIKAYDSSKFNVSRQLEYAQHVKSYLPKSHDHINAVKSRYPSFTPGIPFEKMMENYLKKLQDDFNRKDSKVLSLEERMIRYAKEFKESAQKRENLVQRIETLIENQEVRKKLEEFFKWEKEEMEARNDQEYCFQFFVKLLRDGKIK